MGEGSAAANDSDEGRLSRGGVRIKINDLKGGYLSKLKSL